MAIAENDILQITLVQIQDGQECNNIFFYRAEDVTGTPTYDEVNDQFALDVLNDLNDVQVVSVANVRLIIKNLTNALDITEVPNVALGTRSGGATPSFVAWGYRLVRSTALTRHGSKRIAGVSELDSSGNTPNSIVEAALDNLADALAQTLVVDGLAGDVNLVPVIVGRFPTGDPNAGELDLSKINPVASAQFIRITSQTTRRAGRGV